jgi:hypothetical protein
MSEVRRSVLHGQAPARADTRIRPSIDEIERLEGGAPVCAP